jgi:hypothetical protein
VTFFEDVDIVFSGRPGCHSVNSSGSVDKLINGHI